MSRGATTADEFVQASPIAGRPPPPLPPTPWWRTLFGDAISSIISVGAVAGALAIAPRLLSWAVLHGVWSGGGAACRNAGACWAFLRAKSPFILFGIYPPAGYWRPTAVVLIFIALTLWTLPPRRWTRRTLGLWALGTMLALMLMGGGLFGLSKVATSAWGGLPITLLLTEFSLAAGFPLAVALALGRTARLPVLRWLSIGTIEIIRGLPLLTILFIASILFPLMLPDGVEVDKFLRALVALTVFAAAYIAEVIRGGLQAIPNGQPEAARALGLSWWQTTRLVVLPQAIAKVIPPLTNTVVVIVKDTSLVLVVGLFDLLSSGRAALEDPAWPAPFAETYGFIALIYFVICFGVSRYALWLERQAQPGVQR